MSYRPTGNHRQQEPYRVGRSDHVNQNNTASGSSGHIRRLKGGNSTLKERPPAAVLLNPTNTTFTQQKPQQPVIPEGIPLSVRIGVKEEVTVMIQVTDTIKQVVSNLAEQNGLVNDGRLGLLNAGGRRNEFLDNSLLIKEAMEHVRFFRLSTRLKFGEKTSQSSKWIEEFDFYEATQEVVESDWDISRGSAIKLAALHMQITVPDSPMLSRSAHILTTEILETYLCPKWRTSHNIGLDIHREYVALNGVKKDVAVERYLNLAYEQPGYGEVLFLVATKAGQTRQQELLAIGGSRVARLNPQTKQTIVEFGYSSIRSIHPPPDFPLDTSSFLTLQTETGQHVMGTNSEGEAAFFALLIYDYQQFLGKQAALFQQKPQEILGPIEFDVEAALNAAEEYVDEVLDENCTIM